MKDKLTKSQKKARLYFFLIGLFGAPLEVLVFILVSQQIGLWWTVALVFISTALGMLLWYLWILRLGSDSEVALNEYGVLPDNIPPGVYLTTLADTSCMFFAFFCFLSPGFISDLIGFLIAIPPIRKWYYSYFKNQTKKMADERGITIEELIEELRNKKES